jgi:uncharacterized membrane protein
MKVKNFKKWIISAGVFNMVAAFPLSMPFLYKPYYSMFNYLNSALNLGGKELIAPVEGVNMLFVNTSGLALFLVGMVLIYASKNVKERIEIPLLNAVVRFVFAFVLFYYVFVENIAGILIVIAVIDLIIVIAFSFYIFELKKEKNKINE